MGSATERRAAQQCNKGHSERHGDGHSEPNIFQNTQDAQPAMNDTQKTVEVGSGERHHDDESTFAMRHVVNLCKN